MLDLGLLLLNFLFSPFRPEPHNHATSLSAENLSRSRYLIVHVLVSSRILLSFRFSMLYLNRFLMFLAAGFCVIYFCFIRLASFCIEYLVFPASYPCTNLLSLSLLIIIIIIIIIIVIIIIIIVVIRLFIVCTFFLLGTGVFT